MDKGRGAASWEQVHRSLFPGGPVPSSLLNAKNGGAGILGPAPASVPRDGFPLPMAPPPGAMFGIDKQPQQVPAPPPMPPGFAPPGPPLNQPINHPLTMVPPPSSVPRMGSPPFVQVQDNAKPVLPPPPPQSHFLAPPPRPRNLEMVKSIETMAAFVAKYGEEAVAKDKQFGNPSLSFLYGGEPGSDAALGLQYYEWKKAALTRLLQARKAVGEGKLPPDRLKSMERELEQYTLVQQLKDVRPEVSMPPPESSLRAWNQMPPPLDMVARHPPPEGQHFPRREAPEPPDKRSQKSDEVFNNGPANQSNDFRKDNKRPRATRDPRRERNNDVDRPQVDDRRRRNRSRSPDRMKQHRSPRRRHRSHSRSPRRKDPREQQEINLSPRRESERHQQQQPELQERREGYLNNSGNHLRIPVANPQPQVLPPPPPGPPPAMQMQRQSQQRPQSPLQQSPGFLSPPENAYSRFMSMVDPPSQVNSGPPGFPSNSTQDSGLLRSGAAAAPPPSAPLTVPLVGAFPQNLSEIPPHQQQIFLQQLQLAAAAAAAAAAPSAASTPSSEHSQLSSLLMASPAAAAAALVGALGSQVPIQVSSSQQQQQKQQQQQPATVSVASAGTAKHPPQSPSNDVEMEVVEASPSPQKEVSSKQGEDEGIGADSKLKPDDDSEEASEKAQKGKTDKDGRALKVVRNTVAEFVKELLNPKWREGILSKEDFKLIAKKAVDKVVGNLQGSQIPKGAERVEKFMSSSKEKITKLVQEYVEKHAKHNAAATAATDGTAVKSEAA